MSLTDEQAMALYRSRYARADIADDEGRILTAHEQYERLTGTGWTIEPPKPRFRTVVAHTWWYVQDRDNANKVVSAFHRNRHPDAEQEAKDEADRLNGGAA